MALAVLAALFVTFGLGGCQRDLGALPARRVAPPPEDQPFDDDYGLTDAKPEEYGYRGALDTRRRACEDSTRSGYFIPDGALTNRRLPPGLDRWAELRLSSLLRSLHEPSLSCGHRASQDYRFSWLPDFHDSVVVRVTVPIDPALLPYALRDGLQYKGPLLLERGHHEISRRDLRELNDLLVRADFWRMPSTARGGGADGARWVVEVRKGGAYHIVDRWSPRAGPFRELGRLFMRLADLPVNERVPY